MDLGLRGKLPREVLEGFCCYAMAGLGEAIFFWPENALKGEI